MHPGPTPETSGLNIQTSIIIGVGILKRKVSEVIGCKEVLLQHYDKLQQAEKQLDLGPHCQCMIIGNPPKGHTIAA